jgi:uncharacterized protein involved in exopolysaccharide biosynthesis
VSPLPNIYTADAVILVQQGTTSDLSSSIFAALGIELPSAEAAPGFDMGALVLQVLQSRTFVDKVIEEFDIVNRYRITNHAKSSARKLILDKSDFQYNRTTRSISISFEDIDPVFARDVTNRMVNLLNDWFAQNMGNSRETEKKLLEEKVNEVKGEVTKLENQLKDLQKRYGVLTAQDLGSSQASALAELRSQLILKEIEIKNYSTISAIEDPKIQQLKDERQNILDLIAEQIQRGGAEVTDSSAATSSQKSLPDIQLDFNHLSMELDVQRRIYNTISHQYEVMKIASEPEATFQILELAEVPDVKSGPKRSIIVILGVGGAIIISAMLAVLLNSLSQAKDRLHGPPIANDEGKTNRA